MPVFYTAVGYYGSPEADRNPTIDTRRVHFLHNDYIKSTTVYSSSTSGYHQFGMYIYYISGELGEFANVDFMYNSVANQGNYILQGTNSGANQMIQLCLSSSKWVTYARKIVPGWNYIMFGGSTGYFLNNLCNSTACNANGNEVYSPASLSSVSYGNLRTYGCYSCSDTSVEYIIHVSLFSR